MCFRVRLAFAFFTHDVSAFVSLGLLLRIGDSFLTRNFLLDSRLFATALFNSLALLSKHPKKANDSPTLGTAFPRPVFSPPLPSLPDLFRLWFYDTPICPAVMLLFPLPPITDTCRL